MDGCYHILASTILLWSFTDEIRTRIQLLAQVLRFYSQQIEYCIVIIKQNPMMIFRNMNVGI